MAIKPQKQSAPSAAQEPENNPSIAAMPDPLPLTEQVALLAAEKKRLADELDVEKRRNKTTETNLRKEIDALNSEILALKESPIFLALENAGNTDAMEKKLLQLCQVCLDSELPVKGALTIKIGVKTGTAARDDGSIDTTVSYTVKMPAEREGSGRVFMEGGKLVEATAKQVDMFNKRRGAKSDATE